MAGVGRGGLIGLAGVGDRGDQPSTRREPPRRQPPLDGVPEELTGRRIVAAFVDLMLLGALFGAMAAVFGDIGRDGGRFDANLTGWPFGAYIALVFAYYTLTEWSWRATPGKRLLGLRIAPAGEEPLTFGRVLLRQLLRIVDGLPFLYLVGFIAVSVSRRHQRLGDMAARTVVVRAAEPTAPA